MRKNPLDIGKTTRGSAEDQTRNGARRVDSILDGRCGHTRHDILAAIGFLGMRVNDGFAPVQLLKNGSEHRMTKKSVFDSGSLVLIHGEHANAVRLERVE